jgi:ribosomal protein L24
VKLDYGTTCKTRRPGDGHHRRRQGQDGKVLRVIPDKDRVIVEGINRVWKHVRPSQRYPQGGRIQKDAPIHLSNVMPVDPTSGKPTRVRFRRTAASSAASRCAAERIWASCGKRRARRRAASAGRGGTIDERNLKALEASDG